MSRPRFLLDENLGWRAIVDGLKQHNPAIDVLHVGEQDVPAVGTLDPEVLAYCEHTQRMLVTENRASMPGHVADFYQAGHRHWGSLKVRQGRKTAYGGIIESLILIWEPEEAEEYLDRERWTPL